MKKLLILISLFFVATCGCLDNGTMEKYDAYAAQYENDSNEYNEKLDEFIEITNLYEIRREEYLEAYDSYCDAESRGVRLIIMRENNGVNEKEKILDSAVRTLKVKSEKYELCADKVYNNLDEFETFVIANEDTLVKKGINTVQLKSDIRNWKDEIENTKETCRDVARM